MLLEARLRQLGFDKFKIHGPAGNLSRGCLPDKIQIRGPHCRAARAKPFGSLRGRIAGTGKELDGWTQDSRSDELHPNSFFDGKRPSFPGTWKARSSFCLGRGIAPPFAFLELNRRLSPRCTPTCR